MHLFRPGPRGPPPAPPSEEEPEPPLPPVKIRAYESSFSKTLRENRLDFVGLFVFFMVIPIMFFFVYQHFPTFVLTVACLCFVLALAPLSAGDALLSGSLTACVLLATLGGLHSYHAYVQPLRFLQNGRNYTGVYASQPAINYSGAALLGFAANASVDASMTLGMTTLEGGVGTYCVAPVVDPQSVGRADFWAIGVNCCGKMANFQCDQSGDPQVHAGYVIQDSRDSDVWFDKIGKHFMPSIYRRDLFLRAVKLAQDVHGVVPSPRPVMVRWSTKTRAELDSQLVLGFSASGLWFLGMAAMAALILSPLLAGLRARRSARLRRALEERKDEPKPMDFRHVVLQGFVLPFLSFALCVLLGSWAPCSRIGDFLLFTLRVALAGMAVALLASKWSFRQGIFLILASLLASYIGYFNHIYHAFPYCSATAHRSYSNVKADASWEEHQDAGKLRFEQGVLIGTNWSSSYLHRGVTYCAAPVLPPACGPASAGANATASATGATGALCEVNFWAVGTDCCGPREGFRCSAGGSTTSLGQGPAGIVLRGHGDQGLLDQIRRNYLSAVNASALTHGLLLPAWPALLYAAQESKDLERQLQEWRGTAIGVCLLSIALAFLVLAGMAFAGLSMNTQQDQIPLRRLDF